MTKQNKQKIHPSVVCVGLLCITGLELAALAKGFNGTLLKGVLVLIALAIGVNIPKPKFLS